MRSPSRSARWLRAGYDSEGWRRAAACRETGQDLFFATGSSGPETEASTQRAKAVCGTCPVEMACLRFALSTHQEFGVWGGRDEEERRQMRRQLPRALP